MNLMFDQLLFSSGVKSITNSFDPFKRIILYHNVTESGSRTFNTRFISNKTFEKHLSFLKANCHILSLAQYFSGEEPGRDKPVLAITFDDGLINNINNVFPILEKYDVPATFFISGIRETGQNFLWPDYLDLSTFFRTKPISIDGEVFHKKSRRAGFVSNDTGESLKGKCKRSDWSYKQRVIDAFKDDLTWMNRTELEEYWKQMDLESIREVSESKLIDIGAHGYFHNNLDSVNLNDASWELEASKKFLENTIQKSVDAVAFPDGAYSRELVDVAERIGYKYQLACEYLHREDVLDKRIQDRFTINPYISFTNQKVAFYRGSYY